MEEIKKRNGRAEEINTGNQAERISQLKGFLRSDYEIVRKTSADGERTYHHTGGSELKITDQSLSGIIRDLLNGLNGMVDILVLSNSCANEEPDIDDIIGIVKNHVHSVEMVLNELDYVIENSLGEVVVESLFGNNVCYRDRRMLHAYVECPAEEDDNDRFSYDHDPKLLELVKSIPPDRTSQLMCILNAVKHGEKLQWRVAV